MSDYRKYHDWKRLPLTMIKKTAGAVVGGAIFYRLLQRNRNTHYLMLISAMGDSMHVLSYYEQFKKLRGFQHVTVVCPSNSVRRICTFYPEIDEVVDISLMSQKLLYGFFTSTVGEYVSVLKLDRFTCFGCATTTTTRTVWDNPYITFPLFYKCLVLKIPADTKPKMPQVPHVDISDIVSRYGLIEGKTVFLNPTANSVKCDIYELLADTAEQLCGQGYRVVTTTANEQEMPVRGTDAVPCSLEQAYWLVKYGGTLVGLRSGFLDVLAYTGCRIVAIMDEGYGLKDFCRLEDIGVDPNCHTIVYNGDDETALRQIMDVFENQ